MTGEAEQTASQHGDARTELEPEHASNACLDAPAGLPPLAPANPPPLAPEESPSEHHRSDSPSALGVPILQPAPPPSPKSTPAVATALVPVANVNNAKANAPTKPSADGKATRKTDKGKHKQQSSEVAAKPIRKELVSAFICGACIMF